MLQLQRPSLQRGERRLYRLRSGQVLCLQRRDRLPRGQMEWQQIILVHQLPCGEVER